MQLAKQEEEHFVFNINWEGELVRRLPNDWEFVSEDDLTPKERELLELWAPYSKLGSDLFRFYAGIFDSGREWIALEFEFYYFTDPRGVSEAKEIFELMRHLRTKGFNPEVSVMDSGAHLDHSWQRDENGQKINEKFGKDHGRPFKQLEVSIDLFAAKLAVNDVKKLMDELRLEFKKRDLHQFLVSVV